MSDPRTDFFASAKSEAPKADPRAAFFEEPEVPRETKKVPVTSPYAYYDPTFRREAGIEQETDLTTFAELVPGFNRGSAGMLGLPADTAANVIDLLGAGYGTAASMITGRRPDEFYEPYNREQTPLTGDWFARKMDEGTEALGLGPSTQMINPEAPGHQFVYNIGMGVPGAITGGQGSVGPAMAGTAAGAIGGELGADPATQVALSLLASHAAAKYDRPLPPSKAREVTPETAQETLNRTASKQSMGAAGASVDLAKLSPDLREAVTKAVQKTGGAINPDVLARDIQADSLPVKVFMTEGQKLGDERLISLEQNARGKSKAWSEGFRRQNEALVENLRVMRDEVGPDVFSTNPAEHGDTIISRYKAIDEARNADIGQKYQALRDAAGGDFPVDTKQLLSNVQGALKKDLVTSKAPSDAVRLLEESAAQGAMTLEDFESLRTSLARVQRSSADGQERHAAGVIRKQVEALPLLPEAAALKGVADTARSAAAERFAALDADPAYKAAVTDKVPPDSFVNKFLIGGTRDNVAKLRAAMDGDDAATQTVKVATLEHLRKAAGVDPNYNGNFSQAGYNKALQALEPKLGHLLDGPTMEHLRNLGDVARYTQFQPKGSFVNNSNTFVAAASEKAADALEGIIDFKAGGIPIASGVRKAMNERKVEKAAEASFAPGSGLTKLSELTKLKKKGS